MDDRLLVKVSKWYYEEQVTQEEIARRIGISRSTISRMLTSARRRGIVKISVERPPSELFNFDLEGILESTFHLNEVVVCNCEPAAANSMLGATTADLLLRNLAPGQTIGLSWGRSVATVVDAIPRNVNVDDLTVIALSGGVGAANQSYLGNTLVLKLADRLNAQALTLDAPAILRSETYEQLVAEPAISRVLARGETSDIVVVGIGALGHFSTLTTAEYLEPHMLETMEQLGAIGDLCSRFYAANGTAVVSDLDRRTIGITFDALRKIPQVIAVAWGPEKILAILGALRLGVLNVLVTDISTATALVSAISQD